jgi:DNA-binding LytR/AlgR family response regulator
MQKISCLIVDDEPLALTLMESYVKNIPFLDLKGKCLSAFEALEKIEEQKIDFIFLDIQMPDLNGVEFSRLVQERVKVVFTTAFSHYALEGYRVNAVDYLLKPFSFEEFFRAAEKAKNLIELLNNKASQSSERNFIFVKSEHRQIKIDLNDVLYFEGFKDYIKIWTGSQPKPVLSLMSLKSLEEELDSEKFMRIHRSFIVSLDKIQSVERGQIIINAERITVADQYKEKFSLFLTGKTID